MYHSENQRESGIARFFSSSRQLLGPKFFRSLTVTETALSSRRYPPVMLGFSADLVRAEGDRLRLPCANVAKPTATTTWLKK